MRCKMHTRLSFASWIDPWSKHAFRKRTYAGQDVTKGSKEEKRKRTRRTTAFSSSSSRASSTNGSFGKRWTPPSTKAAKDFETMMILWDQMFELCCEDEDLVGRILDVSRKGYDRYGKGCVLARVYVKPRSIGFGSKGSKLVLGVENGIRKVENAKVVRWEIKYMPARIFQVERPSDIKQDEFQDPLLPVPDSKEIDTLLRAAGDKSTLVKLIGVSMQEQDASQALVDLYQQDTLDGPYHPEKGEVVLFLSLNLQGLNVVGADVVLESGQGTLQTRMDLRA